MIDAFYDRVERDDLLSAFFPGGVSEAHRAHVTAWWIEVFGGPADYTSGLGGYKRMLDHQRGLGITAEQRFRFAALMSRAADDAQLREDAEFRAALNGYLEWGTRLAVHNSAGRRAGRRAGAGAAVGLGRRAAVSALKAHQPSAAATMSRASSWICARWSGPAERFGVELVDVLGAGRPRGEPAVLGGHLQPADRRVVAGRGREPVGDRVAGQRVGCDVGRRQLGQLRLLARGSRASRCARRPDRRTRRSARGTARTASCPVTAVISDASRHRMMPSLSVVHTEPSRCRKDAPADSSPPNATEPSSRPGTNHLNPTGTSSSVRPSDDGDPIDHGRADQRLADRCVARPVGAVGVQVVDRDREVVVRVHQPAVGRDDAVPVGVGVVAGRDVEVVLARDQRRHRRRRRAVHPDLAVPVERHEPEGLVDQRVHHGQVEAVARADLAPVRDRRAAERVGADAHAGRPDRVEVDDLRQRADVAVEEVVACRPARAPARTGCAARRPARGEQLVRAVLDPAW